MMADPTEAVSGLIERIEAATGPDREIDAAIYQMLNPQMVPTPGLAGGFYDPAKTNPLIASKYHLGGGATGYASFYTRKIDDALTLVPPECRFNLNKRPHADARQDGYHAQVWFSRYYDGISVTMERARIGQFGNAVVPQIPEMIGRAILASIAAERLAS